MEMKSWEREEFLISNHSTLLDLRRIHAFLSQSYWAKGIPLSLVERSIKNSLCFGLYAREGTLMQQIGFARVVSDATTFAYLADVYVEQEFEGKGLGTWLVHCVMEHPDLQGLRRFCLGTRDAHRLYEKFGFEVIREPKNWMEIKRQDPYGS